MYHIQHAKIGFREIRLPNVLRGVANFPHKIIWALQESREREGRKILAQYQNDSASMFSKFE